MDILEYDDGNFCGNERGKFWSKDHRKFWSIKDGTF